MQAYWRSFASTRLLGESRSGLNGAQANTRRRASTPTVARQDRDDSSDDWGEVSIAARATACDNTSATQSACPR